MITTAVLAALYSTGSLSAAVSDVQPAAGKRHHLQAPDINPAQIIEQSLSGEAQGYSVQRQNGLNVQLNRQTEKFVYEPEITGEHVYVVRLRGAALVNQRFSTTTQAKRDAAGKLFVAGRAVSQEVSQAQSRLLQQQRQTFSELAMAVGSSPMRQQFTTALNAFTVTLDQDRAALVAKHPQVASVQRAKTYQMHTDVGPQLIEADAIWSGQATAGVNMKGEGLIVGVIDSGINSDHPAFQAVDATGYRHTNPFGSGNYVGDCALTEYADRCNDKLIGMRSYPVLTDTYVTGELGGVAAPIGEDYHGHGTHVASTVAGNIQYNAPLSAPEVSNASDGQVLASDFFPQLSGVAPRANIISYQVCQPASELVQGCPGEALLASIEDAIADGVDVINFSIGGQDSHPWSDALEIAFLGARKAGILVAAAAGNSGQSGQYEEMFGAIDHASPWLLNVAATSHGREVIVETSAVEPSFVDSADAGELPKWSSLVGGGVNEAGITGVVVKAEDYPNIYGEYDAYCREEYAPGTFDAYPDGSVITMTGQDAKTIVVCARDNLNDPNGVARNLKATNIAAGGADGFVLYNYGWSDPISYTSVYALPAIHISSGAWNGDASNSYYGLKKWLTNNGKGHQLTIQPTLMDSYVIADEVDKLAPFSSRGPSPSTPEALIPAVSAPGVNIYAAWSDEHPFAQVGVTGDYTFLSGTSMASPHAAGALALLRQAHPDWSASEIQSALVATADETVTYHYFNRPSGEVMPVSTYRAGTGRINVANAVQAGLVLDESADNFMAADPNNGGAVHRLNLPQLVNFNCQPTCTWLRTVRATKDGTWQVSHDDVVNWAFDAKQQFQQNGITIEAHPTEFTLQAGETQTIVVTASVMDTQDPFSNSEVELHSTLRFQEVSDRSPAMHWPMVFKYDANGMPSNLSVVAHRNDGSQDFNGIDLPEGNNLGRVYQPVKAEQKVITLPKDLDYYRPWSTRDDKGSHEERLDDATDLTWVYVPQGSKRLVAEVTELVDSELKGHQDLGNFSVYIGKDYNGNQVPDLDEEILCVSTHLIYKNFCNVNNPEEGNYWVVFHNSRKGFQDAMYEGVTESYRVAIAVVEDAIASNMSVEVPYSDGREANTVTLDWSMPEMAEGDLYYSMIDFGTSEVNLGNVGKVALKLARGKDDVSLSATQRAAKKGDVIGFNFNVLANQSGRDRAFELHSELPEGLKVLRVDSNKVAYTTDLVQEGQSVVVSGVQEDSSTIAPDYQVTTNLADASCRTPNFGNANVGGYVDLAEFNIVPVFGGFAPIEEDEYGYVLPGKNGNIVHSEGYILPVSQLFGGLYDSVHLYNNTDYLTTGIVNGIEIRATGMISFMEGAPLFGGFHFPMPNNGLPYEQIAPLWRAQNFTNGDMMSLPLFQSPFDPEGISIATTQSGWGIIEYDNARSYAFTGMQPNGAIEWTEKDDRFDFELLFNVNTLHGDGQYELIMAYDNIDFGSQDGRGSIGLQGYRGPAHTYGPLEGFLGKQVAYENLDEVLTDGLVICYDYQGPEVSEFQVTIWAEVQAEAVGKDLTFNAVSKVAGMADIDMSYTLNAPSNITLGELSDHTIDENTSLEDLVVYYADEENSVNEISVSGDNISAEVDGHTSGSTVTITPAANFHGEVEVTITVSDVENPADAASTSFTLTVVSDGEEPDTGGTTEPKPEPEAPSSSSGSVAWWMMAMLGLLCFRRRLN
ncbi:S8 family serine peptidase [Pseudidiomarina sediminum]|nr:S8 family serine peptidase [Pseudidiomarina sediminum]MBY6065090.1 S8 family serine peptidase [Pseudidiomarina sediminum]